MLAGVLTRSALAVKADEVLRHAVEAEEFRMRAISRSVRVDVTPTPRMIRPAVAFMSIDREAGGEAVGLVDALVQHGLPEAARSFLTSCRMDWRQPMSASPSRDGGLVFESGATRSRDAPIGSSCRPGRVTVLCEKPRSCSIATAIGSARQRWVFDRVGVVEMQRRKWRRRCSRLVSRRRQFASPRRRRMSWTTSRSMHALLLARSAPTSLGRAYHGSGRMVRVEGGFASRSQAQAVERALRGMRQRNSGHRRSRTSATNPVVAGAGLMQRLDSLMTRR